MRTSIHRLGQTRKLVARQPHKVNRQIGSWWTNKGTKWEKGRGSHNPHQTTKPKPQKHHHTQQNPTTNKTPKNQPKNRKPQPANQNTQENKPPTTHTPQNKTNKPHKKNPNPTPPHPQPKPHNKNQNKTTSPWLGGKGVWPGLRRAQPSRQATKKTVKRKLTHKKRVKKDIQLSVGGGARARVFEKGKGFDRTGAPSTGKAT